MQIDKMMALETLLASVSPLALAIRAEVVTIESLQSTLADCQAKAKAIQAKADKENRSLTEDEATEIDGFVATFEETKGLLAVAVQAEHDAAEADQRRRAALSGMETDLATPLGRRVQPEGDPQPNPRRVAALASGDLQPRLPGAVRPAGELDRCGFDHMGQFAMSVRAAGSPTNPVVDPRLLAQVPDPVNEGVGEEGGFLVPPDFRSDIIRRIEAEDGLLNRTDQLTTGRNSLTFPVDETTVWGTGGITTYWEGEGKVLTQSKPAFRSEMLKLNKLTALVPVTEEMLEDSVGIDSYLRTRTPQAMTFDINRAIYAGSGVGQPMGFLNSPATVVVAKEGSQPADTIVVENIVKMWARLYGPWRRRAVWLVNQDIEPQLHTMTLAVQNVGQTENVGGVPVYMPAGGVSGTPFATLYGRPVIPTEAAETLGDKGDIALVDLQQYMSVVKSGGVRSDISIHLWFDYDTTAYRFIFRVGGQPWMSKAISPRTGSNTLSAFVTLAERA